MAGAHGARGWRRRTLGVGIASAIALGSLAAGVGVGVGGASVRVAKAPTTTVAIVVGDTAGTKGPMTMTVTPATAPAGKVKFSVTNKGTVIHEMVVLKLKAGTTFDQLPVSKNKISEAGAAGEVADIAKGKTKSVTLKLKAGSYALVCNVTKHYGLGMRAAFAVT
jgi:uncharacterized cupredoxin-like copper-binding protein